MTQPQTDIPVRAPAKTSADDTVQPFDVSALDLRGRVVRLGPAVDGILAPHNYPPPVAKLLGEAVALTVLLGTAIKIEGRFILQTQTDGPVRMLVVDFRNPGNVRACARFDAARVAGAIEAGKATAGALLGRGHLAMTIDQGTDTSRYQGLVALDGGSLEDAAHEYFKSSEQIPTRVRLAVGVAFIAFGVWRWLTRHLVTKQPAWLNRLGRLTPVGACAVAVGLILINPKVLLMNAAAGLVIGTASVGAAGVWVAVVYYTVISGSSVLLPILAYAIAGDRVDHQLELMKQWMERQHAVLTAGFLVVVGLLLVYTGIRAV